MKENNLKNFKLNTEGSFSITRPYESNQVVKILQNYVGNLKNKIITDATACMGGDLINFSKTCKFINGVEIDPENFEHLIENSKRFGCQNVNLFCQDYLEIFDKLKQNIIYMDPPWGGTDYKSKTSVSLKMGDEHLWRLIEKIRTSNIADYIFVKVPLNVCLDFIQFDNIEYVYNKNKTESFKLLIIVNHLKK